MVPNPQSPFQNWDKLSVAQRRELLKQCGPKALLPDEMIRQLFASDAKGLAHARIFYRDTMKGLRGARKRSPRNRGRPS